MSERHQPQTCAKCGVAAPYTISAPRVFSDFPAYVSPSTGKVIEGKKARIEDLARSGCRPYEEGEMQDAERRAREAEKETDALIDETVERTLVEMKNG